jgi:hypothetical protein
MWVVYDAHSSIDLLPFDDHFSFQSTNNKLEGREERRKQQQQSTHISQHATLHDNIHYQLIHIHFFFVAFITSLFHFLHDEYIILIDSSSSHEIKKKKKRKWGTQREYSSSQETSTWSTWSIHSRYIISSDFPISSIERITTHSSMQQRDEKNSHTAIIYEYVS